jgi:hypothetical protein
MAVVEVDDEEEVAMEYSTAKRGCILKRQVRNTLGVSMRLVLICTGT